MIDSREDRKDFAEWIDRDPALYYIETDYLMKLAVVGLETCEDYCSSREELGDDGCFCVRARFSHQNHYHLYLSLRLLAKKLASLAAIEHTAQPKKTERS